MTILLPDGYQRSMKRYPVIFLLHGFNQQHSSWFTSTRLVQYASSYSVIIVSPDAKNSWYTNSVTQPELRYEDLLMKDIIPFIDTKYRTKKGREFRSIAGLSMGGYGALKFALKYPSQFHFAAGLSPSIQFPVGLEDSAIVARRSEASNASVRAAFGAVRNGQWPENDIFSLVERIDERTLPYLYLSVGSNDNIPEVIVQTHQLAGLLRKKKARFEMHESEGGHEWNYWDSEIEKVLRSISGKQK
jgi:S-formylglutathione hydrolase FrmB